MTSDELVQYLVATASPLELSNESEKETELRMASYNRIARLHAEEIRDRKESLIGKLDIPADSITGKVINAGVGFGSTAARVLGQSVALIPGTIAAATDDYSTGNDPSAISQAESIMYGFEPTPQITSNQMDQKVRKPYENNAFRDIATSIRSATDFTKYIHLGDTNKFNRELVESPKLLEAKNRIQTEGYTVNNLADLFTNALNVAGGNPTAVAQLFVENLPQTVIALVGGPVTLSATLAGYADDYYDKWHTGYAAKNNGLQPTANEAATAQAQAATLAGAELASDLVTRGIFKGTASPLVGQLKSALGFAPKVATGTAAKAALKVAGGTVVNAAVEAPTEGYQRVVEGILEHKPATFEDVYQNTVAGGLIGGITGGLASTANEVSQASNRRKEVQLTEETNKSQDILTGNVDSTLQSDKKNKYTQAASILMQHAKVEGTDIDQVINRVNDEVSAPLNTEVMKLKFNITDARNELLGQELETRNRQLELIPKDESATEEQVNQATQLNSEIAEINDMLNQPIDPQVEKEAIKRLKVLEPQIDEVQGLIQGLINTSNTRDNSALIANTEENVNSIKEEAPRVAILKAMKLSEGTKIDKVSFDATIKELDSIQTTDEEVKARVASASASVRMKYHTGNMSENALKTLTDLQSGNVPDTQVGKEIKRNKDFIGVDQWVDSYTKDPSSDNKYNRAKIALESFRKTQEDKLKAAEELRGKTGSVSVRKKNTTEWVHIRDKDGVLNQSVFDDYTKNPKDYVPIVNNKESSLNRLIELLDSGLSLINAGIDSLNANRKIYEQKTSKAKQTKEEGQEVSSETRKDESSTSSETSKSVSKRTVRKQENITKGIKNTKTKSDNKSEDTGSVIEMAQDQYDEAVAAYKSNDPDYVIPQDVQLRGDAITNGNYKIVESTNKEESEEEITTDISIKDTYEFATELSEEINKSSKLTKETYKAINSALSNFIDNHVSFKTVLSKFLILKRIINIYDYYDDSTMPKEIRDLQDIPGNSIDLENIAGKADYSTNTIYLPDREGFLEDINNPNSIISKLISDTTGWGFEEVLDILNSYEEVQSTESIVLHEKFHLLTSNIRRTKFNSKLYDELESIFNKLKELANSNPNHVLNSTSYWKTNIDEFLSEFTSNYAFMKSLLDTKLEGFTPRVPSKGISAFHKVFSKILDLLGLDKSNKYDDFYTYTLSTYVDAMEVQSFNFSNFINKYQDTKFYLDRYEEGVEPYGISISTKGIQLVNLSLLETTTEGFITLPIDQISRLIPDPKNSLSSDFKNDVDNLFKELGINNERSAISGSDSESSTNQEDASQSDESESTPILAEKVQEQGSIDDREDVGSSSRSSRRKSKEPTSVEDRLAAIDPEFLNEKDDSGKTDFAITDLVSGKEIGFSTRKEVLDYIQSQIDIFNQFKNCVGGS